MNSPHQNSSAEKLPTVQRSLPLVAHAGDAPQSQRDLPLRRVVKEIVSGGQTGVDRGALEAALQLGIEHGGWCPRGRLAEDGRIPDRYRLTECDDAAYHVRTEKNVLDSDGTLILSRGELTGGTKLTRRFAKRHQRPWFVVDLNATSWNWLEDVRSWLLTQKIVRLNIAGPRESSQPGIQAEAERWLTSLFA